MNILMLNYEFPPMGGGAGNATHNISQELAKKGHSVTVLTSRFKGQDKEEIIKGVKVYRVFSLRKGIHDCGLRGAYSYLFSAIIKLWSLTSKSEYDILHYFFSFPTGFLTLAPGKHRRIPYIVSLRGSDVPYYDIHNKTVHRIHMILKPINRHIWKRAKAVVALSKGLMETALITAPTQKIAVIPNGVESDLFVPDEKHVKNRDNTLRLITVSRLINRKGIDHTLKAIAGLRDKNISLLVVGTGSYENALKELCTKLGLDGIVKFHGYCPREELYKLYSKADVFILPSLVESFGLVFAEAMACGLPVIGGRTGGVPELIKDENGILVEPGNVDEIKMAIVKMKDSQEMRLRMGKTNREKVSKYYTWSSIASSYLQVY